jgi:hypothetical protein
MAHSKRSRPTKAWAPAGSHETSGSHLRELVVQVQKDVSLLVEEIQTSALVAGETSETSPQISSPKRLRGRNAEEAAAEMSKAIEEVYQAGAEITTALDSSRAPVAGPAGRIDTSGE